MRPVVKLPSMKWFRYEKIYTGSLGTDPLRGCSSCTTFNYRIKLVKHETQEELVAVCFYQLPWNCKTNISEYIFTKKSRYVATINGFIVYGLYMVLNRRAKWYLNVL